VKHTWRQWLWKVLGPRRAGSVSCRVRARPRFHPSLETLEDRTLPSGGVPFVQSINRVFPTGPTTNATSVSYAVTFNEAVTGVVASDFMVTTDGSVQAATPVVVSGNGSAYTVAVNGIHGSGDLGLDLIDDGSIQAGGIPLGSPGGSNGSFQGQTYNILQTYPWVVSINRTNPAGPMLEQFWVA